MEKNKILTIFLFLAVAAILLSARASAWDWFWEDDNHDDDNHGCSLCGDWSLDWDCDLCDDKDDEDENECGLFDDCEPEGEYEWTYKNGEWKKIYYSYEKDDCGWWGDCDDCDGCDSELSKNLRIKTYHFETEILDDDCSCWYGRCVGCEEKDERRYPISSYEERQQRLAAETNTNRGFKLNNKLWTL